MKEVTTWFLDNWQWLAPLAAVVLSTVATQAIRFYGPGRPALVKFLRFLLSLIATLPPRGADVSGLKLGPLALPLLSVGKEK